MDSATLQGELGDLAALMYPPLLPRRCLRGARVGELPSRGDDRHSDEPLVWVIGPPPPFLIAAFAGHFAGEAMVHHLNAGISRPHRGANPYRPTNAERDHLRIFEI